MTDKAITEWIEHHLDKKETTDLWDLSAAILTELSKRDSVSYRVRASTKSVAAKLDSISGELTGEQKRELLIKEIENHDSTDVVGMEYLPEWDETTHDSEGC
tara:strand:- start:896 stop:1201 length:306 start_codon:yes stop_codon:yes gene_type:complete